jgi:hypothetical protein
MSKISDTIIAWYDEMISHHESVENYEACNFLKISKESYLDFQKEGTVLFRGERYTAEEVIEILKEIKDKRPQ